MNWYLKDGDISQNEGDIELTDDQAQQVIDAKMFGQIVSYENNELIFTEPVKENVEPAPYVPTAEELQAQNEAQKVYLISEATQRIAILQDAVDLDMAEAGDEANLKAWKIYRVTLSKIDTSSSEVTFPDKPE